VRSSYPQRLRSDIKNDLAEIKELDGNRVTLSLPIDGAENTVESRRI
jgi:hypothetical protein